MSFNHSLTGDGLFYANTYVGHEFYINQTEIGTQQNSNATMLSNGNYVVTWFDAQNLSIMAREMIKLPLAGVMIRLTVITITIRHACKLFFSNCNHTLSTETQGGEEELR